MLDWEPWLQANDAGDLRMKNTLRFNHYADAVAAAVAGQGRGYRAISVAGRISARQSAWWRHCAAPLHRNVATTWELPNMPDQMRTRRILSRGLQSEAATLS